LQRVFRAQVPRQGTDEALIHTSLTQMIPPRLAWLEKALTGDWFVANAFSMADIAVASILVNFQFAGEGPRCG
jgi:glutathione S-transferase